MVKFYPPGGMAERLKAHVLKTCLGHTNVGSNPTPSARRFTIDDLPIVNPKSSIVNQIWGGARVVEWGRLLSGYWGEILSRRFESCPPRHKKKRVREGAFLVSLPQAQLHPQMRRLESQPLVKSARVLS